MKHFTVQVDGINLLPEEPKEMTCDIHCPDIGTTGLNFWKERCEIRQRDKQQKTCYGGCRYERTKSDLEYRKQAKKYGAISKDVSDTPEDSTQIMQKYRNIIVNLRGMGMSHIDIAKALEIDPKTIKNALRSHVRKLEKMANKV